MKSIIAAVFISTTTACLASPYINCQSKNLIGTTEFAMKAYMSFAILNDHIVRAYSVGGLTLDQPVAGTENSNDNLFFSVLERSCTYNFSVPADFPSIIDFDASVEKNCDGYEYGPYALDCHFFSN